MTGMRKDPLTGPSAWVTADFQNRLLFHRTTINFDADHPFLWDFVGLIRLILIIM